jgi:hypothetical protein
MRPLAIALCSWLLTAGASGCGFSNSASSGTPGTGSGGYDGGVGKGGATGTGTGGTTSGGAGGSSSSDAGTDAGGATGTGGAGGPPPCFVEITPVSSADFVNLPAGPNAKLRVRGIVSGTPPPSVAWRWTATIVTNTQPVPVTTPDPQDPALIEIPLTVEGAYDIKVSVSAVPACGGTARVTATFSPSTSYWLRITAPPTRSDPPHEEAITVQAGMPQLKAMQLYFDHSTDVAIDPQTAADPGTGQATAVSSYVMISSPAHSWTREGNTENAPFQTSLVDAQNSLYDVLVVPLFLPDAPIAPMLFPGSTAGRVAALAVILDQGTAVSGTTRAGAGAAVVGAKVVLRAGALPSTIGTSDATGAFALRARAGRFSALILPPDGSPLPEARVDATAASGIDLPATGAAVTLAFAWRNDLAAVTFAPKFTFGGAPASGLVVSLDSDPDGLPNVGTLQVTGGPSGPQALVAAGAIHRTATTDAAGSVSFAGVPRGTYTLMALPDMASPAGVTVAAVDLTQGLPAPTVGLASRVAVTGRLVGAAAGTRLLVLDDAPAPGRTFPAAPMASDGSFTLSLDPGHAYHLLTDPPAGQNLSRIPLGPLQTGTGALDLGDRPLPKMFPFQGMVSGSDMVGVGGALVQVFCMGPGPDCVDYSQLGAKDPLPIYQTTTSASGAFAIFVPDPAAP